MGKLEEALPQRRFDPAQSLLLAEFVRDLDDKGLRDRNIYFFQSAPSTNPINAATPKVAMGCSFMDLSTYGLIF
jgi:hypothetical protein